MIVSEEFMEDFSVCVFDQKDRDDARNDDEDISPGLSRKKVARDQEIGIQVEKNGKETIIKGDTVYKRTIEVLVVFVEKRK
jgi:hypothetical protein